MYEKIRKKQSGEWTEPPGSEPDPDDRTDPRSHGHHVEPAIVRIYEQMTGYRVERGNYWEHGDENLRAFYGCSPDGKVWIGDRFEGLLECKAPFYAPYADMKDEHLCQVQYQMHVVGKPWCDYVAAFIDWDGRPRRANASLLAKRVYYSEEFCLGWMMPRLSVFSECLLDARPTLPEEFASEQGRAPRERVEIVDLLSVLAPDLF